MSLLAGALGLQGLHVGRHFRNAAILGVAAMLMAGVALAFLFVALQAALLPALGPVWAPLAVAAIAAVLAGIAGAVAASVYAKAQRRMSRAIRSSVVATAAPAAMALVGRKAGLVAAAAALATGFWAARRRG